MLVKYRLPGGPPPPLHEYGVKVRSARTEATTARNVKTRQGCRRSRDASHSAIATAPGKKYGTKPKWRPIRKYSTLWTNRFAKSCSTLSASESLVLCSGVALQTSSADPSNGNVP